MDVQTSGAPGEAGFLSNVQAQAGAGRFNGRRIDLDLKDADIHNNLRLLADVGRVNIRHRRRWCPATSPSVCERPLGPSARRRPASQRARDESAAATWMPRRALGSSRSEPSYPAQQRGAELDLRRSRRASSPSAMRGQRDPAGAKTSLARGRRRRRARPTALIARPCRGHDHIRWITCRSLDTRIDARGFLVEAPHRRSDEPLPARLGCPVGRRRDLSEATGNPTASRSPRWVDHRAALTTEITPTAGSRPSPRTVPTPNFAVNLPGRRQRYGQGGALGLSRSEFDCTTTSTSAFASRQQRSAVSCASSLSPRILTLDNREARTTKARSFRSRRSARKAVRPRSKKRSSSSSFART